MTGSWQILDNGRIKLWGGPEPMDRLAELFHRSDFELEGTHSTNAGCGDRLFTYLSITLRPRPARRHSHDMLDYLRVTA